VCARALNELLCEAAEPSRTVSTAPLAFATVGVCFTDTEEFASSATPATSAAAPARPASLSRQKFSTNCAVESRGLLRRPTILSRCSADTYAQSRCPRYSRAASVCTFSCRSALRESIANEDEGAAARPPSSVWRMGSSERQSTCPPGLRPDGTGAAVPAERVWQRPRVSQWRVHAPLGERQQASSALRSSRVHPAAVHSRKRSLVCAHRGACARHACPRNDSATHVILPAARARRARWPRRGCFETGFVFSWTSSCTLAGYTKLKFNFVKNYRSSFGRKKRHTEQT
jgi:hypothetical protein